MSDLPQQATPDLHEIFGIDGEDAARAEPVIALERSIGEERGIDADKRSGAKFVEAAWTGDAAPALEVTSRFSTRPESTISTSMTTRRPSPTTSTCRSRDWSSAGGATMAV